MMGQRQNREPKLFYSGFNLNERVPADNLYRRIAASVDFDPIRGIVAGCYGHNGHESLDPIVTFKLMLIAFMEGLRSERELMKALPLRLDWLWFCSFDLDSDIPVHSVLSKARRLWGLERFSAIFKLILEQCIAAGLVDGQTAFVDSTLLKANADVRSRIPRRLWNQLEAAAKSQEPPSPSPASSEAPRESGDTPPSAPMPEKKATSGPLPDSQAQRLPAPPQGKFNAQWVSRTDPDAATTKRNGKGITLGYRDHSLVDNRCGIILATIATSADYGDAQLLPVLLDEAQEVGGIKVRRVGADSQYGSQENYARMKRRRVQGYLKPYKGHGQAHKHWLELLPEDLDKPTARRLMKRRGHIVEGRFAEAHTRMHHRRCRWRGRARVQIQCDLVAIAQNIKKLARYGRRGPASTMRTPAGNLCHLRK